ncbi:hypothetical protein WJX72_007910 [[Myrmecia] bisecta]|uniref:Transcription factor Pcc1 n=1 Tax=[Myrmecia] bisecta TaxID=41462 RepID=A0AAW1P7W2_9CHLO
MAALTVEKPQLAGNHVAKDAQPATQPLPFQLSGRIEYASARDAEMIRNTLAVDPELRPDQVKRELQVQGSALVMHFQATDARTLRAAVGTFCDLLGLATRTLEMFGPSATSVVAMDTAVAQPTGS